MNPRFLLPLFALFYFPIKAGAQPGGGGGLKIETIITWKPGDDPRARPYRLRQFCITNPVHANPGQVLFEVEGNTNYLPPASSMYNYRGTITDCRRLMLTAGNDTMLLDIIGLPGENGAGHIETMDTLQLIPGHWLWYSLYFPLGNNLPDPGYYEAKHRGFTAANMDALVHYGIIEQATSSPLNFLAEENLSASFLMNRADRKLREKNYSEVRKDALKALDRPCRKEDSAMLYSILSACDLADKNYAGAIENLSRCIDLEAIDYRFYHRAELYALAGDTVNARKDIRSFISFSDEPELAKRGAAAFLIQNLSLCEEAEEMMHDAFYSQPNTERSPWYGSLSWYNEECFLLGLAQYCQGREKEAFDHWLLAMELGYGQTSSPHVAEHFDSLIRKHPGVPELYLCRAMALYKRSPYNNETPGKVLLQQGYDDTARAEELGMNDFRVYLFRAMILEQLDLNEEGLKVIERSIEIAPNELRNYRYRYALRSNLGQTIWGNQKDPDLVIIQEMLAKGPKKKNP